MRQILIDVVYILLVCGAAALVYRAVAQLGTPEPLARIVRVLTIVVAIVLVVIILLDMLGMGGILGPRVENDLQRAARLAWDATHKPVVR
ncbi:MAG TPA: hypothetical protein VGJ75_03905 [Dongiaceae bacterium]